MTTQSYYKKFGVSVAFYTALMNKNSSSEPDDTFEAADFDEAADIIRAKYPDQAFRLYLGKVVPEKKVNQAIPPKIPKKG